MRPITARRVGTLLFAAIAVTAAAIPWAGAAPARPQDATVVGTYRTFITITGSPTVRGTLTINADGTASDNKKHVGTWSQPNANVTIILSKKSFTEELEGKVTAHGISNSRYEGSYYDNGPHYGSFYAKKIG